MIVYLIVGAIFLWGGLMMLGFVMHLLNELITGIANFFKKNC